MEGLVTPGDIIGFVGPDTRFNFKHEAASAAVNEACEDLAVASTCSVDHLCESCHTLAVQIEHRLQRAFVAGQMSMMASGD